MISVLFILATSLFVGFSISTMAFVFPSDPNEPAFGIEREVNGDIVTLRFYHQALSDEEMVIVSEFLPYDDSYVLRSASIEPLSVYISILDWVFAKDPPRYFSGLEVYDSIPTTITYRTNGAQPEDLFSGNWMLEILAIEGDITNVADITIMDVLNAINNYKRGSITILDLLSIIEQYK
jgi:hypothetical protein